MKCARLGVAMIGVPNVACPATTVLIIQATRGDVGASLTAFRSPMDKSFTTRKRAQWLLVFLIPLLVLSSREGSAQESTFDKERYYRAAEYCRRSVWPGPMLLSPDSQILCFSGAIVPKMDLSLAKDLKGDGLFVVRSPGGRVASAVELSDLIRDRHATVVVYDFCYSACADYFLIASHQTYVLKSTLVAWHNPRSGDPNRPFCTSLTIPRDGGPKKLQRGPCGNATFGDQAAYSAHFPAENQFYKERAVNPVFDAPPDSLFVRKIVRSLYEETGVYRDIAWTIHPRYYPRLFKTKIFHESYPESQGEVDDMVVRLGLKVRVIYDP